LLGLDALDSTFSNRTLSFLFSLAAGQYEPGNYSNIQTQQYQRSNSNMTQREGIAKFENERIKTLQDERLHIQKKTFTKWMNSFLFKVCLRSELSAASATAGGA